MTESVRFPAVLNSEVGSRWSDILTEKHTNTTEEKNWKNKNFIHTNLYLYAAWSCDIINDKAKMNI